MEFLMRMDAKLDEALLFLRDGEDNGEELES